MMQNSENKTALYRITMDRVQGNLRYWRWYRRMRITDVVARMEVPVTQGVYSGYERGDVNIPIDRLADVAQVLDVPIVKFFDEVPMRLPEGRRVR